MQKAIRKVPDTVQKLTTPLFAIVAALFIGIAYMQRVIDPTAKEIRKT